MLPIVGFLALAELPQSFKSDGTGSCKNLKLDFMRKGSKKRPQPTSGTTPELPCGESLICTETHEPSMARAVPEHSGSPFSPAIRGGAVAADWV